MVVEEARGETEHPVAGALDENLHSTSARFRMARAAAKLSREEAAKRATALLPTWAGTISREIIRKYEQDAVVGKEASEPLRVAALAAVYNVSPRWLIPDLDLDQEDLTAVQKLIEALRTKS